jgi:serine/threonine-protein kinase
LPEAHIALGYFHYHTGLEYEEALKHLAVALELRPSDSEALIAMGFVRRRQGNWEEALDAFREAERISPRNYALIQDGLGATNMFARRFAEAERYMDRAISVAPDVLQTYYNKTWLYLLRDGDRERAEEALRQAIGRVNPSQYAGQVRVISDAGTARILPDLYDEILNHAFLDTAGLASGEAAYYYVVRGEMNRVLGRHEVARACYDSALALLDVEVSRDPEKPGLRATRATAYAGLGKKEEAILDGEAAVRLLPVSKDAIQGTEMIKALAEVYAMVGEHEKAIEQLEHLLSVTSFPSIVSVPLIRIDPIWDPLRGHPRFQRLLEEYSGEES